MHYVLNISTYYLSLCASIYHAMSYIHALNHTTPTVQSWSYFQPKFVNELPCDKFSYSVLFSPWWYTYSFMRLLQNYCSNTTRCLSISEKLKKMCALSFLSLLPLAENIIVLIAYQKSAFLILCWAHITQIYPKYCKS